MGLEPRVSLQPSKESPSYKLGEIGVLADDFPVDGVVGFFFVTFTHS